RPDRPDPAVSASPATPPTTGHAPPERPRLTPAPGTGSPSRSDGRGRAAGPHPRTPSHRTPHQQTRSERRPTTTRPTRQRPQPHQWQREMNPSPEDSTRGKKEQESEGGSGRNQTYPDQSAPGEQWPKVATTGRFLPAPPRQGPGQGFREPVPGGFDRGDSTPHQQLRGTTGAV